MPSYPNVTAEMMQEMDRMITGRLTPPENARKRTLENRKTGAMEEHLRWNESLQVVAVEVSTTISNASDEHDVYSVKFNVTASKGTGLNIGGTTYLKARINSVALEAGNKDSGQYKMSISTLVRLAQLVRSAGFPIKGGLTSAQMAAYFPANGESPLIGKEIFAEIHQNESELASSGWNEEVANIFPLRVAKATTEV